jgi:hypothetical protein
MSVEQLSISLCAAQGHFGPHNLEGVLVGELERLMKEHQLMIAHPRCRNLEGRQVIGIDATFEAGLISHLNSPYGLIRPNTMLLSEANVNKYFEAL